MRLQKGLKGDKKRHEKDNKIQSKNAIKKRESEKVSKKVIKKGTKRK